MYMLHIYIHIHADLQVYIHIYIYIHKYRYINIYIYTNVCIHMYSLLAIPCWLFPSGYFPIIFVATTGFHVVALHHIE